MEGGDWRLWGLVGLGAAAAAVTIVSTGTYFMGYHRGFRMKSRSQGLAGKSYFSSDNPMYNYLVQLNVEDPGLKRLREFTLTVPHSQMASPVEEDNLLTVLCKTIGARKVIDIGVFTGCSAYAMALGLPTGGKVVACDVDSDIPEQSRRYWEEGGVADKIDLRIKPATETLQQLVDNGEEGTYDMVFIDADKPSYPAYYKFAMKLLRVGGLIVVDNALGFADQHVYDDHVTAVDSIEQIRTLNRMMRDDERIDYVLLNFSEGVGIGLKLN